MQKAMISWGAVFLLGFVFLIHALVTPGNLSDLLQEIPPLDSFHAVLINALNKPYIF